MWLGVVKYDLELRLNRDLGSSLFFSLNSQGSVFMWQTKRPENDTAPKRREEPRWRWEVSPSDWILPDVFSVS